MQKLIITKCIKVFDMIEQSVTLIEQSVLMKKVGLLKNE